MDKSFEQQYHELEATQWWFTSRRHAIGKLLPELRPGMRVLDIGCAGGLLLQQLEQSCKGLELFGLDVSPEAIERCHARGLNNTYVMDATRPELPENSFDLIISSDCLEHVEQDELALHNWQRLLRPGGQLILFVPAWMFLWGPHDVVNHHFRRYRAGELKRKLQQAGFDVARTGYWNVALFFPALLLRGGRNLLGLRSSGEAKADDLLHPPALLNSLLTGWLRLENVLLRTLRFPVGISAFSIARRSTKN